jgi:tetratricopeptide (TPR) repeat protein
VTTVKQIATARVPSRGALAARALITSTLLTCGLITGCATSPSGRSDQDSHQAQLPRDSNALLVGAELALQRKQYLQAAQWLSAAAAASDDESLAERATTVAYEHHQDKYVLVSARRWLEINSSSEQARRFAGFAALRLYRIDDAAEQFQALLDSTFISPQAGFMALAPQWFEEGSRPAVLALMQNLVVKHAETAEAQFVLAQAALQAENIGLALSSAKRATELSPYWAPAHSLLARAQLAAGQADAALATARAAAEQQGSGSTIQEARPETRLDYAQLQYAAGKQEEARRELEALSELPEVGPVAQRSLAFIDLDLGRIDDATRRWRALVQSGRFVYEGMFYLGQIAERRGETSDAIELYERITAGDLAVGAQTRAALLKSRAGTVADGVSVLHEFAKAHPENTIDMLTAEAGVYAEFGNITQGVKVLNEGLAQYPDNDALRVSKALLLERDKRSAEAIVEMRALVRDRPNDPTALNMLGYTLVDRTRNIEEGLGMIRRALELMPDNGAILDSMGWALHRQHRDTEALDFLQRAHERARDPEIAVHLGDVLAALHRGDEAQKTWEQALAAFPDNADLKQRVAKGKGKQP